MLDSVTRWYGQRPIRERVLLLFCSLTILVFIVYLGVLDPLSTRQTRVTTELSALKAQQLDLQTREFVIMARKSVDPEAEKRRQLSILEEESASLQKQLEAGIVNLVAPADMPVLLKDLLTQQKKLQLVSLENLAPRELLLSSKSDTETQAPALYLHPLRMEFTGDYLTLLKYLRQLRQLPKALVWEDIDIETQTYPEATVRIQVYTLSLTEGWIGG
jgi:MSHA biogenesis protein MshJ